MHKELLRTAGVFVFLQSETETKREKTIKHPEDRRREGGGGWGVGGTLTVLALGDSEPLDRYGLVRSGIMRNG